MNAPWFVPLAAGLENLVFLAVVILFILIPGLGQVLSKIREAQQAEEARRRMPAAPRPPAPARPQGAPPQQDPLRREVGDFLRKAPQPRAPGRPQQTPAMGRPATAPPVVPPWQRPAHEPVPVELLEPVPEDAGGAGRGRSRPPERELESLPASVPPAVAATGGLMQGHLHEMFDHHLGTLGDTPGESGQAAQPREAEAAGAQVVFLPTTAAAELAAMLANPVSLRQAILFQEILQRPEHRWQ
jgi:hypothetical protein